LKMHWRQGLDARRAFLLLVCLSLMAMLVQTGLSVLHPLEVINSDVDGQHACPLSHAAAALTVAPRLLPEIGLAFAYLPEFSPWFGRSPFLHPLAPRPPPTSLL
jgi:hypothetical protein